MSNWVPQSVRDEARQVEYEQNRLFNRLGGVTASLAEQQAMAQQADRLKNLYADLEMIQPEPDPTDTPHRYQAKLLAGLARFTSYRDTKLGTPTNRHLLPQMATVIEQEASAVAADRNVGSFRKPGQLREIHRTVGNRHTVEFHGPNPDSWMRAFKGAVCAAVENFNVPRR